MALNVNIIARQRRQYLQKVLGAMRILDQKQEKLQSKLRSTIRNKRKIPDMEDMGIILTNFKDMSGAMNAFAQAIGNGYPDI